MDRITLTPDEFSRAVTALGAGPLPAALCDRLAEYVHETMRNAESQTDAGLEFTEAGEIVSDAGRLYPGFLRSPQSIGEITREAFALNRGADAEPDEQIAGMIALALESGKPFTASQALGEALHDLGLVVFVATDDEGGDE